MVNKVQLGRTDLWIHPIGFGANKVGPEDPSTNTEYGGKVLATGIERGMNFIDTAFMYGKGVSEEIIGKTIKENNWRDEVVIATKGAHKYTADGVVFDNSPDFLVGEVEKSLKRLQTDVIDLYYIHFPDEDTPKYEAVGALHRLKEQGKIRAIGVSNFSLEQLKEANQDGYVDVVQGHYNLLNRSAEKEFFPYFKEHGISFIPYFPLASGLLVGKYTKDTVITGRNKERPQFQPGVFEKNVEKVDQLKPIAEKHQASVPQIVLAFYLTLDTIDAVIPGARNITQVLNNLETANIHLDQEDIAKIEAIFPVE